MFLGCDLKQPETTSKNVHPRASFTDVREANADATAFVANTREPVPDSLRGQQHIHRAVNHAQEAVALRVRLQKTIDSTDPPVGRVPRFNMVVRHVAKCVPASAGPLQPHSEQQRDREQTPPLREHVRGWVQPLYAGVVRHHSQVEGQASPKLSGRRSVDPQTRRELQPRAAD